MKEWEKPGILGDTYIILKDKTTPYGRVQIGISIRDYGIACNGGDPVENRVIREITDITVYARYNDLYPDLDLYYDFCEEDPDAVKKIRVLAECINKELNKIQSLTQGQGDNEKSK